MRTSKILITMLVAAMASVTTGCGSDGNTGTGTTAVTDTASATDSTGSDDSAAESDSSTGDDTETTADTATAADTTTTADTTPADDKCDQTDQTCLVGCRNDKCGKELSACTTNTKCVQLNSCLGGCSANPPVAPPAEVTGTTCIEKCKTLAGDEAFQAYGAIALCVKSGCLKSAYTPGVACAQNDSACLEDCLVTECSDEATACDKDKDCFGILQCVGDCGSNQSCAQGCVTKAPAAGQQLFMGLFQCLQGNCL